MRERAPERDQETKLAKRTRNKVRIITGAKDLAGNAPAADEVWSFTTGSRQGSRRGKEAARKGRDNHWPRSFSRVEPVSEIGRLPGSMATRGRLARQFFLG